MDLESTVIDNIDDGSDDQRSRHTPQDSRRINRIHLDQTDQTAATQTRRSIKMNAPSTTTGSDGINGPLNPFVIDPPTPDAKEDEIPGYVKRFGAYVSGFGLSFW